MSKFNMSEWRSNTVVVKAGEVYEFVFMDTSPNVFYIQNPHTSMLYASLSKIPTLEVHEFEIKPNRSDAFGRPLPANRIYLLNPSSNDMVVTIMSNWQEFDIGLLKDMYVEIDTSQFKYDGMINGFKAGVSLPVTTLAGKPLEVGGTKLSNIEVNLSDIKTWLETKWGNGSFVEKNSPLIVTRMDSLLTKLTAQATSVANIETDVDNLATTLPTVKTAIDTLKTAISDTIIPDVDSIKTDTAEIYKLLYRSIDSTLTDIKDTMDTLAPSVSAINKLALKLYPTADNQSTYMSMSQTNSTVSESYPCNDGDTLKLLTNDGTSELKVEFGTGTSKKFSMVLKPGESLTDFPVLGFDVYVMPNTVSPITYRIVILTY